MEFGDCLKALRLKNDLTLRDLSKLVSLGYPYLSDIENNKKPAPNDRSLLCIASALSLNKSEQMDFFDSAAKSKSKKDNDFHLPADISFYIINNKDEIANIRKKILLNSSEK
ncbi:MAG: helix-turn-helix transcriptional regulator [Eubacterium sp.]|nr:helix-turn-helix transcriptional regulator [Eubacterium sp.]